MNTAADRRGNSLTRQRRTLLQSGIPCLLALVLFGCLSGACNTVQAQGPENDEVLRESVLNAIGSGQRALIDLQESDGSWTYQGFDRYRAGATGLALLALLNSGLPPDHETIRRGIAWLKRPDVDPTETYDISMTIMALTASGDRSTLGKVTLLAARLEQMQVRGQRASGGWGYGGLNQTGQDAYWDNSNSQFAILGLREAAYWGVEIDREVWRRAQEHFLRVQSQPVSSPNGAGWDYQGRQETTGSMTAAGISSLSITSAMLQDDRDVGPDGKLRCCGSAEDPAADAIDAGLLWMERHFRVTTNPGAPNQWLLYYLYGMERAGRFTGRRFFGDHDWYREGARYLVGGQSRRGNYWFSNNETDEMASTSLALLFLSKGLSPIVVNKLQYGPRAADGELANSDWNRHPRDVMNLIDYLSGLPKWPKLIRWQVVDLNVAAEQEGVGALLQSPVQYLSGTESLDAIQGRELNLLRDYIAQGGFIFAVQNCESAEFDIEFRDLLQRLFEGQQYEFRKLPPTHDVYRSEHVFPAGAVPELWGVDFGCRTAIIYAPYDHACRWDKWMKHPPSNRQLPIKTQIEKSMMIGANVIAYATGRELQDSLQRPEPLETAEVNQLTRGRLTIARVRHTGGWDTAPNALRRLQIALESVNIDAPQLSPTIRADDDAIYEYPILYMHGRKNFQFSEPERENLQQYINNGGFLFADACCGSSQFDESFRQMIQQTFGQPLERIPADDEIYNMEIGYDIRQVQRRIPSQDPTVSSLVAEQSVGEPVLEGIKINDKYVLVYSKYDLSCALERQSTSACAGYPTEDAMKIGVNLVLYGLFQ